MYTIWIDLGEGEIRYLNEIRITPSGWMLGFSNDQGMCLDHDRAESLRQFLSAWDGGEWVVSAI